METTDAHSLAVTLEPVLREATGGRLGPIEWFRAAWQHGGAATGFALWGGGPGSVMVKLPIGPTELRWTERLSRSTRTAVGGALVPEVFACGDNIGGIDLAWLVMEKIQGKPLSTGLDERAVRELLASTHEFHMAAGAHADPGASPPPPTNWVENVSRSRDAVRTHGLPDSQRWNEALRSVQKALPVLVRRWSGRAINTWCHGDVHPGNAMRRASDHAPERCVLIDLALVHAGHWVEDAVYLERQFWGHSDMLHGVKPVSELARLRREAGIPIEADYGEVAVARRVLMASLVPLFIEREGNSKYVRGALEVIEKFAPQAH